MGDENTVLSDAEARHLLRRTGFGVLPDRNVPAGDFPAKPGGLHERQGDIFPAADIVNLSLKFIHVMQLVIE